MKKIVTKHIVHIIPTLRYGGAERMVVSLITSKTSATRHSIITLFDDMPLRSALPKDVVVRVVQKKGTLSLHLFSDLEKALREMKPDIVHTHLSGGDIWGRVAARRVGVPIVSTQHNVVCHLGWIKNYVMRRLRMYADVYGACSESVKQSVVSTHRVAADKITVIPNGIDVDIFVSAKKPCWDSPLQLLMIGRLVEQKGHDIALRVLATMKKQDWRLTVVGEGKLGAKLAAQAQKLGIADRIIFSHVTDGIPTLLGKSDIVLMPSRWEGLGVVAMEAMAAGRVVIASDIDGLREVITNEKTGMLVPVGNESAFAEKIIWAIAHKEESLNMAKAAQMHAKKHFGVAHMVERYEVLYTSLI